MKKGKLKLPSTPALRTLRSARVAFEPYLYDYVEKGGTRASAEALGIDEHVIIKTIVLEDEKQKPVIMLQHGDKQVSTKELARQIGRKRLTPCSPDTAQRHTGYKVGGTSPFGTRKRLPLYMESTIAELETIYINGGGRGLLVSLAPAELERVLQPEKVSASQ